MDKINYLLQAFGFRTLREFNDSVWHINRPKLVDLTVLLGSTLGFASMLIEQTTGYPPFLFFAFTALIGLETLTGIHASIKKGKKLSSRLAGRMFLKMGYYLAIIVILNIFSKYTDFPKVSGFELDPFVWMYHGFSVGIVFQLLISVFENLNKVGLAESNGILRLFKRRFEKWLELDDDFEDRIEKEEEQSPYD